MATDIIKALNWRYATKTFNKDKKLSEEQVAKLLEAARLSPSSFGIQPWKFVVVTNPEIRAKLRAAAYNQAQITDASHLVVFTVVNDVNEAFVDKFIASTAKTRGLPVDALKGYGDMIKGSIKAKSPAEIKNWAIHQVYIPLGIVLESAALDGIDACPMEGFDPQKFDEILGLDKLGVHSVALAALGYRASDEEVKQYGKARFSKEEVVIEVK